MIYFNNELVKEKTKETKKLFDEFCGIYRNNIDMQTRQVNKNTPFIIKYRPDMIKDDPDNKGKKLMPNSVAMKLVSLVNIDGSMVEVRYSPTAPQTTKDGPKFTVNAIVVERGRMIVRDIDLAFYLWAYSTQNSENHPDDTSAFFVIDNPEAERLKMSYAKKNEATALARIWNDERDGGLSEARLRTVGKDMMIAGADIIDANLLRETIEDAIKLERGTTKTRDLFLSLSDPHKSVEEAQEASDYAERKSIITESIKHELISHNTKNMQFWLNDELYKPSEMLFDYSEYKKRGDTTNRQALLFGVLDSQRPELLDELKKKLELMKETEMAQ